MNIIAEYKAGRRDFKGAYLQDAYLQGAYLQDANLQDANLRGANLHGANLQDANLRGANLQCAYLRGAYLQYAKLPRFQIPQEGELWVWKKLTFRSLAKCIVPREAKRTASLVGRKCRAEFIWVDTVYHVSGEGKSQHDETTIYKSQSWVYPDSYDDDIRVECSHGIHFFLTKEEAEAY